MPLDGRNYTTPVRHDLDTHWGRLRFLADFMEGVPDELTDIGNFTNTRECGTVRCAIGWAWVVPEFKALGFTESGPEGWESYDHQGKFFGLPSTLRPDSPWDTCFSPSGYPEHDGNPPRTAIIARLREAADKLEAA